MMATDRYENSRNGTAPGRKATENFLPFLSMLEEQKENAAAKFGTSTQPKTA